MKFKKFQITLFLIFAFLFLTPDFVFAAEKETPFVPIEPKLQINIPTVQFSNITKEGQMLGIPFLAEYISGIYKYAVAIVSIIAIVMIMVGGLRWMTAGGNASAITGAKEMISGAVIGLFLVLGSYTVLYTINPDLVSFKALRVQLIEPNPLDGDIGAGNELSSPSGSGSTANCNQYVSLFQQYAPCLGGDYKIIETIAAAETGCNAKTNNGRGYYGLAQTRAAGSGGSIICPGLLQGTKFAGRCSADDLYNPEIATVIIAKFLKPAVTLVKQYCRDAPAANQGAAIHAYNNVPVGARNFIKKGCKSQDDFVEGFLKYYLNPANATAKNRYFADKTYSARYADKKGDETAYLTAIARAKIAYAVNKAGSIFASLGANLNTPVSGSCPL